MHTSGYKRIPIPSSDITHSTCLANWKHTQTQYTPAHRRNICIIQRGQLIVKVHFAMWKIRTREFGTERYQISINSHNKNTYRGAHKEIGQLCSVVDCCCCCSLVNRKQTCGECISCARTKMCVWVCDWCSIIQQWREQSAFKPSWGVAHSLCFFTLEKHYLLLLVREHHISAICAWGRDCVCMCVCVFALATPQAANHNKDNIKNNNNNNNDFCALALERHCYAKAIYLLCPSGRLCMYMLLDVKRFFRSKIRRSSHYRTP